jgi:DNA repair protein RecO (recombination protein O)
MNASNEKSYILHKRKFRESSQLVDFFSRDYGRVRAVAKGTRGRKRPKGVNLQAFTPLLLSWRGRGELKNLTAAEPFGNSACFQGEMLYVGLYLNELLVRLLPEHVPHESLFDCYELLISQLSACNDPEPLLRRFELRLLEEIGYGLDMTVELSEERSITADERYHYTSDHGFVRSNTLVVQSKEDLYEGAHLLAIANADYELPAVRRSAKRLLRCALQSQLGDRPLLSRQLFHQARVCRPSKKDNE